jgi:hypothetical protein
MNYRGNNNEACLPEKPKFRQNYDFVGMLRVKSKFVKIVMSCGEHWSENVRITLDNLGYFASLETVFADKSDTPMRNLPSLEKLIGPNIRMITITRLIEWRNGQTYFYAAYTEK